MTDLPTREDLERYARGQTLYVSPERIAALARALVLLAREMVQHADSGDGGFWAPPLGSREWAAVRLPGEDTDAG